MNETPTTSTPIEIKPLSASVAIEAGIQNKNSQEAKDQAEAVKNIPFSLMNIDAAACNDIPSGLKDELFIALFGVDDVSKLSGDPVLKTVAEGLNEVVTELENNLKVVNFADGSASTNDQINQAIKNTILSNQVLKAIYEALPDDQARKDFVTKLRETSALSEARRLYIERMVIPQESGQYIAAKKKFELIEQQLTSKTKEKSEVDTQLSGKSRSEINANRDVLVQQLKSLELERTNLIETRDSIKESMNEISNRYYQRDPRTGVVTFNQQHRDLNPNYVDLQSDLKKINRELEGKNSVNARILEAQNKLQELEKDLQLFQLQDALVKELTTLNESYADANGELITARNNLANEVNKLLKSLNGVLPEAAKESLNKYKSVQEQANREKQIEAAKKKAEDAKKEEDMIKRAHEQIKIAIEMRYMKVIPNHRLNAFFKGKERYRINKEFLSEDFSKIVQNPDGWVRDLLKTIKTNSDDKYNLKGLSPDVVAFFTTNDEAIQKLADTVRSDIIVSVGRQAFMNLEMDPKSVKTLCNIPDIANAAQKAIDSDKNLASMAEKLAGQKLTKGKLRSFFEKGSGIALAAILLLIFGFIGFKFVTGGA